jgi:hypothetical protein
MSENICKRCNRHTDPALGTIFNYDNLTAPEIFKNSFLCFDCMGYLRKIIAEEEQNFFAALIVRFYGETSK